MLIPIGTNVIIFYGKRSSEHFSKLVNSWTKIISPEAWDHLRIVIAADEQPNYEDIEADTWKYLNSCNSTYYNTREQAPGDSFVNWLNSPNGNVKMHVIFSPGNEDDHIPWLKQLIEQMDHVPYLTVNWLYYFLLKNSPASRREQIISLISKREANVFLLGKVDSEGGAVNEDTSWAAVNMGVLLCACNLLALNSQVNSLGYSTLNAGGGELHKLAQAAACEKLLNLMENEYDTLNETEARKMILPDEINSMEPDSLKTWLSNQITSRIPTERVGKNVWITIHMQQDDGEVLDAEEAMKRMIRFVKLNYAGPESHTDAKAFAQEIQYTVIQKLRRNIYTACFPLRAVQAVIDELRKLTRQQSFSSTHVSYDRRQHIFLWNRQSVQEQYLKDCESKILVKLKQYINDVRVSVYAGELISAYEAVKEWLEKIIKKKDDRREIGTASFFLTDKLHGMDNTLQGRTSQLRIKYPKFSQALSNLQPSTEQMINISESVYYFDEQGDVVKPTWEKLLVRCGEYLTNQVPGYRHGFYSALQTQFNNDEERNLFFAQYLSSGRRMYYNLKAPVGGVGLSYLIVDEVLAENWFRDRMNLSGAKTDNAENLTLYSLGNEYSAADYLKMDEIHFLQEETKIQEHQLRNTSEKTENRMIRSGGMDIHCWNQSQTVQNVLPQTIAENDPGITLMPNAKGDYMLSWKWNGNDPTAQVIVKQHDKQIGRVATIHVSAFMDDNNSMNLTQSVMRGQAVPQGILTVTVIGSHGEQLFHDVKVPGFRNQIKYHIQGNNSLTVYSGNQYIVLRTTENGHYTYYPLYSPYDYSGLEINEGKVVMDPTLQSAPVYIISI